MWVHEQLDHLGTWELRLGHLSVAEQIWERFIAHMNSQIGQSQMLIHKRWYFRGLDCQRSILIQSSAAFEAFELSWSRSTWYLIMWCSLSRCVIVSGETHLLYCQALCACGWSTNMFLMEVPNVPSIIPPTQSCASIEKHRPRGTGQTSRDGWNHLFHESRRWGTHACH